MMVSCPPVAAARVLRVTGHGRHHMDHGPLHIDGSYGEGGGQILRTVLCLSAITGRPVVIENIRARRAKPGLAAQHITAVRAAGAICGARVTGAELSSQRLEFTPTTMPKPGEYALM